MVNWFEWKEKLNSRASGRLIIIGWTLIILLLPFHGFLSVWLSSLNDGYLAWRSWKEALIILMLATGLYFISRYDNTLFKKLAHRRINQLIAAYVLLHLILSAISGINLEAVLYALVYNLRFLGLFVVAQILAHYFKRPSANYHLPSANDRRLAKLILFPASVVIGFALLQLILPNDFLSHFGYGPDTIGPYVTIDNKEQWVRSQSFLRGPNQLGQYLILPLILLAGLWLKWPSWKLASGTMAGGLAILASYSRSAWLGLTSALAVLLAADKSWLKWRKQITLGLAAMVVLVGGLALVYSGSDSLKIIFFHDDQVAGDVADSNQIRVDATRRSLEQIADNPLGYGPGYAGPASFHNDLDSKINENYYLQLALEVGVAGLLVFLAINWLAAVSLWRQKPELWPRVLLAVFVGIALINLFLPAWANDEIGLIFWGLAGLFYKE